MKKQTEKILEALKGQGKEAVYGKGGFWIKGEGFVTTAQARKATGIKAERREKRERISAYGDYATIAMINAPKKK